MKEKPSLLIIGNSNVGKSTITRLLLKNPKKFKGKTGKNPGSTLLIKPITQPGMPYQIVDMPGFGYMRHSSKRREEHIKRQIIVHIEKHNKEFFLGLVIINILRIEDEITKFFLQNKETIPLSFELIKFLNEFGIPILVLFNKIDKISQFDKNKAIKAFVDSINEFGITLLPFDQQKSGNTIPYLEFSALKKTNIEKLKKRIQSFF